MQQADPDPKENPEDWISYHLHRNLANEEAHGRRYSSEYVHASDVTFDREEFCPRQWALYDVTGKRQPGKSIAAAQEYTFRLGNMYQDLITDWLGAIVVGDWKCLLCGHMHGLQRRPLHCYECQGGAGFRYHETRFISRISGVSCGIDLLLDLPSREKFVIVEIKSAQKEDFKKLVMPMAEHRARTCWYMKIVEESGQVAKRLIDLEQARVLYAVKGGWGDKVDRRFWKIPHDGIWSPFKEFRVNRDDSIVRPYHRKAVSLKRFRDQHERGRKGTMPKPICDTQFCGRARSCAVVHECFSGDY